METYALALGAFIALHVGLSATGLRAAAVGRIGEPIYRGLFSLASVALLIWLVSAYGAARMDPANTLMFTPPDWARHVTHLLGLIGVTLGVAGMLSPSPTQVGFEGVITKDEPAKGVHRITRHPFLWGVALWAAGHLVSNGDRISVMLFAGLGLMVLLGTRSIDRKTRARSPDDWPRFSAVTSNVPLAAILQGRNGFRLGETWWRLLVGLIVFALLGYFHRVFAGVPAFSFGF